MGKTFRIVTDYDRTPTQMVKAARSVNHNISLKIFPRKSGKEEIAVEFVQSVVRATPAMVRQIMHRHGFRACTVSELLAFIEAFPEEKEKDKVVALGTWEIAENGTQGFPSAHWGFIQMLWDANGDDPKYDGWNADYRYLVTKKE